MAPAPFVYLRPSDDGTGASSLCSHFDFSCVNLVPSSLSAWVSNSNRAWRGVGVYVFAGQGALMRAAFDGNLGRLKGSSNSALNFPSSRFSRLVGPRVSCIAAYSHLLPPVSTNSPYLFTAMLCILDI
jgi:hypothetical protein